MTDTDAARDALAGIERALAYCRVYIVLAITRRDWDSLEEACDDMDGLLELREIEFGIYRSDNDSNLLKAARRANRETV